MGIHSQIRSEPIFCVSFPGFLCFVPRGAITAGTSRIMQSCALRCLPGMSLLCAGTSPDVHGGLSIQRSSWRESKKKKKPRNRKDCLALPKYFPIGIQQPRHSMKRKKGEQREEGGGLACHGLRVSLCACSSPRWGLRWVGADVPIFPAWPGQAAGLMSLRWALLLAVTLGRSLRAVLPHLSASLPAQTAGFQAKPQGNAFHIAAAHPPQAQHRALCQTPLAPCLQHAVAFS